MLSVVVTARNDNRGGDMLYRMQVFVDTLLALSKKYGLCLELLVVEWNPPSDQKALRDALHWDKGWSGGKVRIITVPSDIHAHFPESDKIPLFQFIAKNVGIRRAHGKYILATNLDIVFSDPMICFLSSHRLSSDCLYRSNRYDVSPEIPHGLTLNETLHFCQKNVIRVHALEGIYSIKDSGILSYRVRKMIQKLRRKLIPGEDTGLNKVHTTACGDFTLMAKDHWDALRGYPEISSHAYVDGLICFMAVSKGLRQVVLNRSKKIYHQEHGDMFIEDHHNRPIMDYQVYRKYCMKMIDEGSPIIFNDEAWGLGDVPLKEEFVGS